MSAEIVSLAERQAERAHPALVQVEAYWDALRNGRPAPARAEVDPRGLEGVLKQCFILERIAPGLARFRVAGRELSDVMGMEMKGMPLSSMFLPEARDLLEDTLKRVFDGPCIARLGVESPAGFKRRPIPGQMLLLPLRSDLGAISRVLGCMVVEDINGPKPRRFNLEGKVIRQIPEGRDITRTRPELPGRAPEGAAGAQVIELSLPAD